jgi:tetratricopeptide (TPR) repeat protein
VAFDRDGRLRNAEKLLGLGRYDAAIEEYQRVLEHTPDDWKTTNTLADLYLRAGRVDAATELLARIADHLAREGFLPRAEAFYKRILKVSPADEHALARLADLASKRGILVEVKDYLLLLAKAQQGRNDRRAATETLLRLGALDSGDVNIRIEAARAAAAGGDADLAAVELGRIVADLVADQRILEATTVLRQAVTIVPSDTALRERLCAALLSAGDADAAQGRLEAALGAYEEAVGVAPDLRDARVRLVRLLARTGECEKASAHLERLGTLNEPDLRLLQIELWLRDWRLVDARARLTELLDGGGIGDSEIAALQAALDVHGADVAWPVSELLADRDLVADDLSHATNRLKQFVARHPGHIGALVKLVEAAVDAGLSHDLTPAQEALADAYIAAGQGAAARVIAEDLVTRAPRNTRQHRRLESALRLVGDPTPVESVAAFVAMASALEPDLNLEEAVPKVPLARAEISTDTVVTGVPTGETAESHEIDLNEMLHQLKPVTGPSARPQKGPRMADNPDPSNLDDVFKDFREEVSRQTESDDAAQRYKVALTYRDMGMIDDAVRELEQAARSPRLRFDASALLARLLRDRGEVAHAIDWFERAAEAPAPTPEAGRQLLYELGAALEMSGENARALAVYLELQADAGEYRDTAARVARLSGGSRR